MTSLPTHGVLLELNDTGLYLIGDSGIGKSEIALQLITQGACLICDDAPELTVDTDTGQVSGHCPEGFYGLMHIHDLGIINIIELFNSNSFKNSQVLSFVIELLSADNSLPIITEQTPEQLLTPNYQYWDYQDQTIPGIHMHLYPNRNIPLMIKIAVMQFLAYNTGQTPHNSCQLSEEAKK